VVWLIREVGGPRALAHRCEDIRRRRWGRATPGMGRPLVQPAELPTIETDPDEGGLGPADAVNIWRGVLITAERTFQPDDDVCKLLRVLAKVPGVLDDRMKFGSLLMDKCNDGPAERGQPRSGQGVRRRRPLPLMRVTRPSCG